MGTEITTAGVAPRQQSHSLLPKQKTPPPHNLKIHQCYQCTQKYANTFREKVNGSAESIPSCKWNHWHTFLFKRTTPCFAFESQSFSKLEAGSLRAAPGCWGMMTAGSLRGHCCLRTEQVGMGWCGRWLGLYTPGQTRWRLGDTSRAQKRTGIPVEIHLVQQVELLYDSLENSQKCCPVCCHVILLVKCWSMHYDAGLTQVMIDKKEKARTARAASPTAFNSEDVLAHWLARTQKQMNHRNVHTAVRIKKNMITTLTVLQLGCTSCFWAQFLYCSMSILQWKQTLTWKGQISYNDKFSVLGTADLWEVSIQYDEDTTSQEGQDSDSNSIVAGTVVVIEHALGILFGLCVSVAFCCNGCKHHNGE